MKSIKIAGRDIGPNFKPYIIAEMSANHNGSIANAFKIINEAKKSGADAVKLQSYTADTITLNCESEDFQIHGGLWDGKSLHELYQEAQMPWEWHKPLFDHARKNGITIFSSPFDHTAVDLLEDLNSPAYKIASFEVIDHTLIKYAASTGKPLIISTGMANELEIEEAIQAARDGGCSEMVILHCVSGYPAPPDQYNLKTISDMADRFQVITGLSDHTICNTTAIASVAMGACVIEKHVTLDRDGGGADDSFSIEPSELKELCRNTEIAWTAVGEPNYKQTNAEKSNAKFRRSIYVVNDIEKGEILTHKNIRSIRPGFGIEPKYFQKVLGAEAKSSIARGTPLSFDLLNLNDFEKD